MFGPPSSLLIQCFTQREANDMWNLERLEFLGDSFLKIAVTRHIYEEHPKYSAGKLTKARTDFIRNSNLMKIANLKTLNNRIIRLPSLMNIHNTIAAKDAPLARAPLFTYQYNVKYQETRDVIKVIKSGDEAPKDPNAFNKIGNQKRLADCVESLLGAYVVSGGEKLAARFMNLLNKMYLLSLNDPESQSNQDILVCPDAILWPGANESTTVVLDHFHGQFDDLREPNATEMANIKLVENELKYKFKSKKIARLALTMHGFNKVDKLDSNERLEFLGDAVLDYLVVDEYYNKRGNQLKFDSGQLTDLKQAITSNNVFGSLAFTLFLPHTALTSDNRKLYQLEYFKLQLAVEDGIPLNPDLERVMSIYNLPQKASTDRSAYLLDVPKWFGDMYEALFGAIWLDCDQSLSQAWAIIRGNLEPVMNIDSLTHDSRRYLEELNPIRKLMSLKLTNGQSPKFVPGKIKPAKSMKDIADVINDQDENIDEYCCHLDKCFVRITVKNTKDDDVSAFGIGSTDRSARFAAATRLIQKLEK